MAEITPMMKQYLEIKEQNKDSILFFRLGDFYEMFNEDAQLASRELDLTLTTRDRGKAAEDQTPMCGIPYHSSDAYIARLIAKGYKVAICEQTEDPALAKGLVKRDIIRVITPGTVIDSACLDDRRGNFLCGIFLDGQNAGAAFCDMTTGHTHVTAFSGDDRAEHLYNELSRFSPAEAVLSAGAYDNGELVEYLRDKLSCAVERGENRFELKACEKAIRAQFGEERFASLPRNNPAASLALGALLSYLHETQKTDLSYIKDLEYYEQGRFMELDLSARRNLELTETIRAKEKRGSLLWVLDKTKTAMGARNLRAWLTRPLRDVAAIERRLGAVANLTVQKLGTFTDTIPQLMLPGVQGVGLAVLRTPLMNCVDGSADAVSIYAPAAGLLHALARCEEQLNTEFANGASRVFASEDLLRPDAQGRRALRDDLFIGLPDDPANVGVTVYSPALREQSYLARKQDLLRGCESLLGLRRGILSETEANADPRTATEIAATSVDYDLTIRDLQGAWGAAVQDAMVLCGTLGALYGLEFHTDAVVPAIDWGDGVLYDRARIWAEQREMVDVGLLRPELALAWYFDLPCGSEAELKEVREKFMPK